ncbi:uncharacterized protein BX664DRAFT_322804 [Halteromyces radiatus]|uniref:uncharacterized protein n=1 Tax=Halteromyces radiatus TaxID=101107 RepID=UPI0022212752|nr:uncharacterized protein BX664DRAFT_322804 [Halteromyces radiatus]KAI8100078.1 hypothetical protein BX664DRAFT_322804 [Halteromyces radiatus]
MKTSRTTHYLYTASLFFLIFLTGVCVAISAVDVIIQALSDRTSSGYFDYRGLTVVTTSYLALAIATLLLACSRLINVRRSLRMIPKSLTPTGYLPRRVVLQVQRGFHLVGYIRQKAEPLPSDIKQLGWAKPGTQTFEGVDFKRAISRTPTIIEKAAIEINEQYARPPFITIRHYIEFLMQQELMDIDFGRIYLEGYEKARFSEHAPTEQEYLDIMKHLAAILNQMGYHLNQSTTPTPSLHNNIPGINNHSNSSMNNRLNNGSNESYSSGASTRSKRSTFSYRQHRNNIPSPHPNLRQYSSDRLRLRPRQQSIPDDDDVASLAHSVATWSSRSAHRYPHFISTMDGNDDDDEDYDENMRHIIYNRLMQSHS